MKKTFASLALAGILTLSAGAVAAQAAEDYPAAPPAATVSDSTVVAGQAFTFAGSGFLAGEIIDITVTQTSPVAGGALGSLGGGVSASVPMIIKPAAPIKMTTTATAEGTFSASIVLDTPGTYTLTATGRTSGVTVTQVVKVKAAAGVGTAADMNAAAGSNAGGLANTGLDAGVVAWSVVGAGALAAGVGTVVVSRRRGRNTENA